MKILGNILVSILIVLFNINISLGKINDPINENSNLLMFIKEMPLNKLVYFKDDRFTYSYSIFKMKDYITVNKIYVKNITNYKIDYLKVDGDFFVQNQVIFIYNKELKLLKSYDISDFNKLFEYISRNAEIINMYDEQYYLLNNVLLKLEPKLIETDKDTKFTEIKVFQVEDKDEYFIFAIMR